MNKQLKEQTVEDNIFKNSLKGEERTNNGVMQELDNSNRSSEQIPQQEISQFQFYERNSYLHEPADEAINITELKTIGK